ncbi:MAG: AAA family ATPase [Mollicutes bacterium]|nr:AAA family ATPase [Mollicutes bacterium]
MYIKNIKIQGFKSFADKIELDFSEKICAIVGPNGSGKSNIVDAILWVLGEQSVKSLRGGNEMSDVIFNGSKTRDKLKKASVAILFDNSDKKLDSEFNEVEVKRIIYSTGENEYYINNARVRLKDVTNMLMDITSKFNIISQGKVAALVENKSSERRELFEAAAGVGKYKKRKEESLKKLDGTKENLTRINLIIKELDMNLSPLEKDKENARKYLDIKKELDSIDVALIAHDINKYKKEFDVLKQNNDHMSIEIKDLNITHPLGLESKKLEMIKIDEKIGELNHKIVDVTEVLSNLQSDKQINIERSKLSVDESKIDDNLLNLNEEKLTIEKDISIEEDKLNNNQEHLLKLTSYYNKITDDELKRKIKLTSLNNEINNLNRAIFEIQNKINIEKNNIENNLYLPKPVKSILNNPRLLGIHGTIKDVITSNEAHNIAINASLGAAANFIIVDDMLKAKKAIEYLKEQKLGRATFFPLDTIKSKKFSYEIISMIEKYQGFIGIASDLVSYNKKYQNIIENQLGNVIVVDSTDDLINISKLTEYKYKIVSLDGEITYPGGSITGGIINNTFKSDLNSLNKELEIKTNQKKLLEEDLQKYTKEYDNISEKLTDYKKKIAEYRITIDLNNKNIETLKDKLNKYINNIDGLKSIKTNSIHKKIDKLTKDIIEKEKEKEILENNLKETQNQKFDLHEQITTLEKEISNQNTVYRKLENSINQNEIEIGKLEIKIDNLITNLSEDYNLTYEYAFSNYNLEVDEEIARSKVSNLKSKLKQIGEVNIGSIDEYDRIRKRYDFLTHQKEDLEVSLEELNNVILEMDEIMKEKFKKSFDKISSEFSKVFRVMFKGGNGILKLSDENDLLNTGIDVFAVPPGKKLNSIISLSGGEKSLTAICLIFAILNVNPAPFIVLDEAEAALDEENVHMFGEYLSKIKNDSQFILITHKKKMMEYADILYGITMEESGVSKLVSVKLETKET